MDFPEKITRKFEEAIGSGALQFFATEERIVRDEIDFMVFVLKYLSVKDKKSWNKRKNSQDQENANDPFLPYEKDLFIDNITDTHICLLNKYNVMKNHILIVTREFEDQESALSEPDFEALWLCMEKIEGLAFYNSGEKAGASQRHKHMQIVELPLAGQMDKLPIVHLISGLSSSSAPLLVPRFEFRHGLYFLTPEKLLGKKRAGFYLMEKYLSLLEYTGLAENWGPYNLLITKDWMLLIPRILECYKGISVNSLGFAGTFLVKDAKDFREIERAGLLKILGSVASPFAG